MKTTFKGELNKGIVRTTENQVKKLYTQMVLLRIKSFTAIFSIRHLINGKRSADLKLQPKKKVHRKRLKLKKRLSLQKSLSKQELILKAI